MRFYAKGRESPTKPPSRTIPGVPSTRTTPPPAQRSARPDDSQIEVEASLREEVEASGHRPLVVDGAPPTSDLVQRILNPDGGTVRTMGSHRLDGIRHGENA